MSQSFSYKNVKSSKEAYKKVKAHINPELMKKFKVRAEMEYNDDDLIITANGKGFTLVVTFLDTEAEVDLNLSLMLKPLKGMVMGTLSKEIEAVI